MADKKEKKETKEKSNDNINESVNEETKVKSVAKSKEKKKKTKDEKRENILTLVLVSDCLLLICLCLYLTMLASDFVWQLTSDTAMDKNAQKAKTVTYIIRESANALSASTAEFENDMITDEYEVLVRLSSNSLTLQFDYLRFAKADGIYNINGIRNPEADAAVMEMISDGGISVTPTFTDISTGKEVFAVTVPVRGNSLITGIVGYFNVDSFCDKTGLIMDDDGVSACLIQSDGNVIMGELYGNSKTVFDIFDDIHKK